MNDFYRSTIESQQREISHLQTEQTKSNKRLKAYWVVGLAGWVLFVGALIWPVNAKASERHTRNGGDWRDCARAAINELK